MDKQERQRIPASCHIHTGVRTGKLLDRTYIFHYNSEAFQFYFISFPLRQKQYLQSTATFSHSAG